LLPPAQAEIDHFCEEREIALITSVQYADPMSPLSAKWFNCGTITDGSREAVFVHVADLRLLAHYVLAIQGANLRGRDHLQLMQDGGYENLLDVRTQQITSGELNEDAKLRRTCSMFLFMDGAATEGVPEDWGPSVTVVKTKVKGMKEGVCQLRMIPVLPFPSCVQGTRGRVT